MSQPQSNPVQAGGSAALFAKNEFLLQRVAGMLAAEGFRVAATGSQPAEVAAAAGTRVDVVLVEVGGRKEPDGILAAARRAFGETPILVLASAPDTRMCRQCLRLGASGIVDLDDSEKTLGATVRAAAAGLVCMPSAMRRPLAPPVLSTREKQILGMVVLGFKNGEIACKLHLAESTVKNHLSSGFVKLGARSRNEATSMILDAERGLGIGILAMSKSDDLVADDLAHAVRVDPPAAASRHQHRVSRVADAQATTILDSKVRVPQNVVYRKFAYETVVLDLKTGKYYGLNQTAGRILDVLGGAANPRLAAAVLAAEYGRPEEDVQADVVAFCADLLARGLLERVGQPED